MSARLTLAAFLLLPVLAHAADWPCWRGPARDGSSAEKSFPTTWDDKGPFAWKADVPGTGHSSPVVSNGRVFLATCLEDAGERQLLCFDRTDGKPLWAKTVIKSELEQKHKLNSFASSTPAADGKHVFVAFFDRPKIQVACYDFDGNQVWLVSPGEFRSVHGFCSSPVLHKDLVILNCDQDAKAYIVAFDKATGKEMWRADRPNKTRSYCTPLIADVNGKQQLVLSGSKCVAAYDPDTGKQVWQLDGPTEQFVASPVMQDGILFVTGGFPQKHLIGIKPDHSGRMAEADLAWHLKRGVSYVPSPIAANSCFLVVSDEGLATCLDARSGKEHWSERLGKHQSASGVVTGNGLAYFTADEGVTYVVEVGPKFKLVSKNPIGEAVYASPALSDGQVFIRGTSHLFCIGERAK